MNYTDIDKFVCTTLDTLNALLEYKNWSDALALYFRYIQQQKMQENVVTKSNDVFMIQAMKTWSKERFYIAKKILVERWMIEVVKKEYRYVKVNYITNQESGNTDCWDNGLDKEESGNSESGNSESGNPATNTLVEKENTLVEKEKHFEDFWCGLPSAMKQWKDLAKRNFLKKINTILDYNNLKKWLQWYIAVVKQKTSNTFICPYKHWWTFMNQNVRMEHLDDEVLKAIKLQVPLEKIQIAYQQEVAKDKDNKATIYKDFTEQYWIEVMKQVLEKINWPSFISNF